MTLEDRIKALYLYISEPEMHMHALDGTRIFNRCILWEIVDRLDRDNSDGLVLILWHKLQSKIPALLVRYFIYENGCYLRWQGIYFRMGLYEEIGFPYKEWEEMLEKEMYAKGKIDKCIFINKWGEA